MCSEKVLAGLCLCAMLAGCSALPSSGPTTSAVLDEKAKEPSADARYSVVDVDEKVISILRRRPQDATLASFGGYRGGASDVRVGVGDSVSLTIWEAGAGGLFSAATPVITGAGAVGGSRAASIPEQVVGRDGLISVPYAGRVRAAGHTTHQIQRQIESALQGKAIQPQVLVTVARPLSNTVTVVGESTSGARVPLSPNGDRVLDVVASAGGVRSPTTETFIQVTRGARTARVAMTRVVSDSRENIYVRPGDVVTVIRDPQNFLAYGATGRSSEIPFDGENMTLAQALTKAGGLLDYRADPDGVFVFRLETPAIARELGAHAPAARLGDRYKVVYHLNFRDPNALFAAQQMRIFHRDLIYVSNAPLSDVQKFMQLFNMVVSPVSQGAGISSSVATLSR
jgi:polysaccharide export outer membrane protein